MLSFNIFGWKLSITVAEGTCYYVVDDNLFKMFGYTNQKTRVVNLKELCFLKSKAYPLIFRESGEVLASTEDRRKSSRRLLPGENYLLTPRMLNLMLLEEQDQGQAKLRSVICPPHFAKDLCAIITAPGNVTTSHNVELSVSCAQLSSCISAPVVTNAPPVLTNAGNAPPALTNAVPALTNVASVLTNAPILANTSPPISRKRKQPKCDCHCKEIFNVKRIVSSSSSSRSKRRRVLASKKMLKSLVTKLPSNVVVNKLEYDVQTTLAGDLAHVKMDFINTCLPASDPRPSSSHQSAKISTLENPPPLPAEPNNHDAEIQVATMDNKLISDSQYHELAMNNSTMVRSYKVQSARKLMSSCIEIKSATVNGSDTSEAMEGSYRDVKDILDYLSTIPEFIELCAKTDTLHFRFAGDGARTSKNKNTIALSFSIIDEENTSQYEFTYPIAIYNGEEDYAFLKRSLIPIIDSMKTLQENGYTLAHSNKKLNIEWFLCSDWKFLAIVLGINPANNKYFCLWCECDKSKIHEISQHQWKCSRTIQECVERFHSSKNCNTRKGIKDLPLLDFIDFDHIVPDTLHLFLRVTDVLFDELVRVVLENDARERLVDEMAKIKPSMNFKFSKDDKGKDTWTSYDGSAKKHILKQLNITSVLSGVLSDARINMITSCWKRFDHLDSHLRSTEGLGLTPEDFQKQAMAFANEFMAVFKDRAITPYIHTLVYHVPEYLCLYGSLAPFNMQAIERINYICKQVFFKKLNKKDYCNGFLQFFNRVLYARRHSLVRTKRTYNFSGKYTKGAIEERRLNAQPRSVLALQARQAKIANRVLNELST